jgi:hypothetical protein
VLEPGGRLAVCVTHPINDAGRFSSRTADAEFVIRESYFGRRRFDETFERDGLRVTFHGWCYPLEAYTAALEDAGFVIERLRETRTPDDLLARDPSEVRWQRVPMFLWLRAAKPT